MTMKRLSLTVLSLLVLDFEARAAITKEQLGEMLFRDRRLSESGTISCESCHRLDRAGVDGEPLSFGHRGQLTTRNSPTVFNISHQRSFFWDGRSATLNDQALEPLLNPIEMGWENRDILARHLSSLTDYSPYVVDLYQVNVLTLDVLADAIATFEKSLQIRESRYDQFLAGDRNALSPLEKRGLVTFRDYSCVACHSEPTMGGTTTEYFLKFHVDDPRYSEFDLLRDLGRFMFTSLESDKNMWKVPTLRNVAVTGPYFHNGRVTSLEKAVEIMGYHQASSHLSPDEITAIAAFLRSLTDRRFEHLLP